MRATEGAWLQPQSLPSSALRAPSPVSGRRENEINYSAALYRYATEGEAPAAFRALELQTAFKAK